jgi:23S rRNA-/tRNA-specific pseudouridylate synthase
MIAAKNADGLKWLQKQFSSRRVKKTYVAIVRGRPKQDEAIIDMPIQRNPKKPQTFRVHIAGKDALTQYKLLECSSLYTMIELYPKTGRTHQIRVHLAEIGCPLVGDTLYGGVKADRLMLHASRLEITLPDRTRRVFEAPAPKEFDLWMNR